MTAKPETTTAPSPIGHKCADCDAVATRMTADGVPLCEGDYQHLAEHWRREFGDQTDAE